MTKEELLEWSKVNKHDVCKSITYWYNLKTKDLVIYDYKWKFTGLKPVKAAELDRIRLDNFFKLNSIEATVTREDQIVNIKHSNSKLLSKKQLSNFEYANIKLVKQYD